MAQQTSRSQGPVLTRQQVRACDQVAIDRFGFTGLVLMENAGSAAARHILSALEPVADRPVCIVTGAGNNAGDGFVVARHLANVDIPVHVLACAVPRDPGSDAAANLAIIQKMALPVEFLHQLPPSQLQTKIEQTARNACLVVDALLGTGTSGPPRQPIRSAIEAINALDTPVVALDIPSGLDCDTGKPLELAVKAARTITFAALKKGFLNPRSQAYTGPVTLASIGIKTQLLSAVTDSP